jgi:hypothetical protein
MQVRLLADTVATELAYTHYEKVAQGFGAEGILVTRNEDVRLWMLVLCGCFYLFIALLVLCCAGDSGHQTSEAAVP